MGDSIFVLLTFVKLTQARVTLEGKALNEELPLTHGIVIISVMACF